MPQSSSNQAQDELPRVDRVETSSKQALSRPKTLEMLSQFLKEEQEQRKTLRDEHQLHTIWKDLQNAYETVPIYGPGDANAEGGLGYDSLEGGEKDEVDGLGQMGVDALNQTVGELGKKISQAASFMGSPDQQLLKEQKLRKQRKKKRKDAKKEAKKQAKIQAKMMMGNSSRF